MIETELKTLSARIELEPVGLTAGVDKTRPVMLFREKSGEKVLPVWLSSVDAGVALTQRNGQAFAMSPHDVTLKAFEALGVKAETCDFVEIKGHQQYVEIGFTGSRKLKNLKARADHAISFCLQAKVKFYCTSEYLEKCRDLAVDVNRSSSATRGRADMRRGRQSYLN